MGTRSLPFSLLPLGCLLAFVFAIHTSIDVPCVCIVLNCFVLSTDCSKFSLIFNVAFVFFLLVWKQGWQGAFLWQKHPHLCLSRVPEGSYSGKTKWGLAGLPEPWNSIGKNNAYIQLSFLMFSGHLILDCLKNNFLSLYGSENIPTHHSEGHWKFFSGGGALLKVQILQRTAWS